MLRDREFSELSARIKLLRMRTGRSVIVSVEEMSFLEEEDCARYMRSIFNPKRCGYRDMFVAWLDPDGNKLTPPELWKREEPHVDAEQ